MDCDLRQHLGRTRWEMLAVVELLAGQVWIAEVEKFLKGDGLTEVGVAKLDSHYDLIDLGGYKLDWCMTRSFGKVLLPYEPEIEKNLRQLRKERKITETLEKVQLDAMAKEIRKLTLASIHSEPPTTCDICGRGHPTHECQASIEEVNAVGNYNFNAMGQKHPRRPQFQPQQPIQSGLEDLMKSFIVKTDERLDAHGAAIKELGTGLRSLERQVGQIATILSERIPSTLPADTEKNSKETVNAVTLRTEQVLEYLTPIHKEAVPENESRKELKIEDDKKTEKKKGKKGAEKKKKEETSRKEESDDVNVNLSFTEVLSQMPAYASGQTYRILQKLEKEIGEIRSVPISLQLADQTTITPEGIVEDVLVRVDKFVFPVNFILVNMEENMEVPLILGRPFLATGRSILDIHDRKLMLRVGEEMVTFEMNIAFGVEKEKPAASVE
ncbi:uncharacterized protein [Nicotiana tomentosiformis]|uniref:uncharacterized protein n=1 Tax=Nicotiana tomentosiformis TaxID=4098 RepID=UPI00388C7830